MYIVCMGELRMDHKVELHAHDSNMFFFFLQIKGYSVTFRMPDIRIHSFEICNVHITLTYM